MAYQCLNEKRKIYFREGSAEHITNLAKIVFDFDGVLVHVLQSYYENIRKVVDYYFLEILGLEGKKGKLVTLRDIQSFKDTGLYNNDWTLTYALLTYYLAILIRKLQQKRVLDEFLKQFSDMQFSGVSSFVQTLRGVGDYCKSHGVDATELASTKNDSALGIESLLAQVMKENQSFEAVLSSVLSRAESSQLRLVKKLVPYSVEKPDLLKRLFEESYLGRELFKKFYSVSPVFNFNECFLDKEEFIPTRKTLRTLYSRFGELSVYSEKPRDQAMYLLKKNGFGEYFEDRLIFHEDLSEQLGKPNPTVLIEMVKKTVGDVSKIAYVGDTVADAMLVKGARSRGLSNLLFFGVLCSSQSPDELLSQFMKYDADVVMMDVNDIPYMYASLKGEI
ncbi:MAG: HAD hydrolase-like protein [Candidatus Bathyarchaeota archaeon]|nr:MAG: HAD hydrolase-like protein [Candidatus Bathyarchaeota archaeon]